jgi:phosphatidylglycerol---prolipoprotein diacylglyceryl transferase
MLTISIDPVAFNIGSLEIRWYGIMVALGVASLLIIMAREAKRRGIPRDIYSIFLWGVIGGLIGGRLTYVIYYWDHFMANPREIIGFQGLAQNGMIIGIVVAALIYMWVTRMRFSTLLSMGDALAVGAPLALAIARVGCTLNGCCYGIPAPDLPWAVVYTNPNSLAPLNTPLHPTQIYHLLWGLIVFAIVLRLRGRFKPEGSLFFFFLCIFAVGDFGIRFLRTDVPVLGGLRQAQVLDMAILAVFLPWLIIKMRRFHRQALVAELVDEAKPEQNRED